MFNLLFKGRFSGFSSSKNRVQCGYQSCLPFDFSYVKIVKNTKNIKEMSPFIAIRGKTDFDHAPKWLCNILTNFINNI